MIDALYTVAAILVVVASVGWIAERTGLPPPILLVIAGIALAVVPRTPSVELEPDVVMLMLLPPLIYYAAFTMSWQAFRSNLRPILLLAIGCVIVTTLAVAAAGHWMIGLPLGVAFILGAVVSPPDVVAPLAVAERLGIPRRITAVLEGEGLVNDATALILFNVALVAVMTGRFSLVEAGRDFVLVLVGEAVWGLIVGSALLWLRHFAREPRIEVMLSLLTPYFAFWPPHELGGSGVLATVVSGLYVGNAGVTLIRSNTRLQALFFWDFLNTTITGAIFLLTGLQARTIAFGLDAATLWRLMLDGVLVSVVVIVVRFLWVFPATYIPRWLFRSVRLHDPTPSWRFPFIIAFTGVRGVVSLAAALSVPVALAPGVAFPARDRLLVLVFVVIVVTLVAQGLTLPFVVRRLGLVQLGAAERRHRRRQEAAARLETARAALARLDDAAREHGLAPEALRSWRKKQQQRIDLLEHTRNPDGDGSVQATSMHRVELELLAAERARLNALLHEGRISDEIRRRIERDLDLAEERVRRNVRGIATDDDADADDPPRR
ncbi:MAG TPA: Na+/H+ antiporter [Casimicrobiaceae bacterium]|nr:Na+/H+ antiporter [Casimicrobiaceae bacterium]